MTTTTLLDRARARFRPGTRVEVRPVALDKVEKAHGVWRIRKHDSVEYRAVRVIAYRDSDDDPLVCVCATNGGGTSAAGWFHPDDLIVISETI